LNVVVTGATSFLGRALVDRLLNEKHQVFAIVRPGSPNMGSLDGGRQGLTLIERQLEELEELAEEAVRLDAISTRVIFAGKVWPGKASTDREAKTGETGRCSRRT